MIAAWSLLQVSFAFAIAGWSTGAASTPAPSRVALDDVFATMRSMTVLTMPDGDAPGGERVRFDPYTRTVTIAVDGTPQSWRQELLERATSSPQIGAMTWREDRSVILWLRSMRVDAALVKPQKNGPTQLVLGEPRERRHLRATWFGELCIASTPTGEHPVYKKALKTSCEGRLDGEQVHALTSTLLDENSRRARDLLLAEIDDPDALSYEQILQNNPSERGFRAQVYLSMALDALERDELERAMELFATMRSLARGEDVWRNPDEALDSTLGALVQGVLVRAIAARLLSGDDKSATEFFERYRRNLTTEETPALLRKIAMAYRRQDRPEVAARVYQQALALATRRGKSHEDERRAIIGELATTYLENDDAFRANAVTLWAIEEGQAKQIDPSFEVLTRWVHANRSCPMPKPEEDGEVVQNPTNACIEAIKPAASTHPDLFYSPQHRAQFVWGMNTRGSASITSR